jgi:hypothetical protein
LDRETTIEVLSGFAELPQVTANPYVQSRISELIILFSLAPPALDIRGQPVSSPAPVFEENA